MELESKETENNNKEVCEEHVGLVLNFVSMLQVMFATQYSVLIPSFLLYTIHIP